MLANLFLHYAFDHWLDKTHPDKPFARCADDAVVHCRTKEGAQSLRNSLENRLAACGLELHLAKTRIVYCKDDDRRGDNPDTSFDFLGYTFQPRRSRNRYGKYFINFTPAVSNKAKKTMRQAIHDWRMHLKPDKTLADLSRMFNPVLRGWLNYFRLPEAKGAFEELDDRIRRRLRCILWRQWKRPYTGARNLMQRGLAEQRAWRSATNGRGPWWNAGASHMNRAFRKADFDRMGLVSLLDRHHQLQRAS